MPTPALHDWPDEMPQAVRDAARNNPPREGAIQVAAWLVRVVKVREVGVNRGHWVTRFLGAVGLGGGYAWCAALQCWLNRLLGLPVPAANPASVLGWKEWATLTHRLVPVAEARRGDLLGMMHTATTGHLGRCLTPLASGTVVSFEGNTEPGIEGEQREGDGAYQRERPASFWQFAIRMDP